MRTAAAAAILVTALSSVAACGKKSACELMSKDEATALVGGGYQLHDGVTREIGPAETCTYEGDDVVTTDNYAHVMIEYVADEAGYAQMSGLITDPVELIGIGTRAMRSKRGDALIVLAHGHVAFVIASALAKTRVAPKTTEVFAKVLADRM